MLIAVSSFFETFVGRLLFGAEPFIAEGFVDNHLFVISAVRREVELFTVIIIGFDRAVISR
jgi:hypothetical protein